NATSVTGSATVSGGTAPYSVQFYLDNTPNGSPITSGSFERNFGPLFVGDHTVRASVTDAKGWVSNTVAHTIHITGPLGVSLTPTNGSTFNYGQSVALVAAPGGGTPPYNATFYTNGQPAGAMSSAPFSLNLGLLPPG